MGGLLRAGMIGGTLWFGGAFLWAAAKVLVIPILVFSGLHSLQEKMTGADIVKQERAARVAAEYAKVKIGDPRFVVEWGNRITEAKIKVINDSDGDVTGVWFNCDYRDVDAVALEHSDGTPFYPTNNIGTKTNRLVVKAHSSELLTLETSYQGSTKPDYSTLICRKDFKFYLD